MSDRPLSATSGSPADMEAMNGEAYLLAMAEILRASGRYRARLDSSPDGLLGTG